MRNPQHLEKLVRAFTVPGADTVACLARLIKTVRPQDPHDGESPSQLLAELSSILESDPVLRAGFRDALLAFPATRRTVSFYADTGVYPSLGFVSELMRRISRTLLPDEPNPAYLRDVLSAVFNRSSDAIWISAVAEEVWCALFYSLHLEELDAETLDKVLLTDIYEALRVISYRIASIGVEPELARIEPALEEFESPFLAQSPEMLRYLDEYKEWWKREGATLQDASQLRVLFDQCRKIIVRVRTHAARDGTSLSLTLLLKRLEQYITRSEDLIDILEAFTNRCSVSDATPPLITLTRRLLAEGARSDDVREYWNSTLNLLARRVTGYADRTGERYITSTLSEYFGLFRSGAVGGVLLAVMALFELFISAAHLPPLVEWMVASLNYGLGFIVIHIVHGTVSTKQPAMTAATIAAGIDRTGTRQHHLDQAAHIVARATRSQLVAILGNVLLAVPMGILLGMVVSHLYGYYYPEEARALVLISALHPLLSGSIFFAAITGVCLFLSGLIAGYYDNLAAYYRIPQRLKLLRVPRRLIGKATWGRLCLYLENNLGALAGNMFLGILFAGVSFLGTVSGLPLDVRHVAFSSAYLGFSLNTLNYALSWQNAVMVTAGVALIGFVNLAVSFTLSLLVAYRALDLTMPRGALLLRTLRLLLHHPGEFFIPPRRAANQGDNDHQRDRH